jgi:tetratricopeptide (TPR) repeat protein/AraC-like DNA-binding protein
MTETLTTDQIFIRKLTEIILANLNNEHFGVEELVIKSGISRTGLNRRLRKVLNKSINQFIREIRLQKALEMLQNGSVTASEVAYNVGFSSPAYFSTCFHEFFGYPPGKVKRGDSENPDDNSVNLVNTELESKKSVRETLSFYKTWILALSGLFIIVAILVYPKIFERTTLDDLRSSDGRISVAVMPFQNMTDNRIWDGIQINLISYLSNFEELKVRQKEAISSLLESKGLTNYASITPSVAGSISRKLDANVFIYGSINRADSIIRVNAELINTKTKEVFKSFQIEGPAKEDEIFHLIDSLSVSVKNFLVMSKMLKEVSPDFKPYRDTNSPEAYQYLIDADYALKRYDVKTALNLYTKAVAIDSNYIPAIILVSMRYKDLGMYKDAKEWCLRAYEKREVANRNERNMIYWYHASLFETPNEEIKFLKQYQAVDDQVPVSYWQTGNAYLNLYQYNKAIPEFEKALDIYKKWGIKPMMSENYTKLGFAYHQSGQYRKEKKLYKKAERNFPGDPSIFNRYAILALTEGDTTDANRYIEKLRSSLEDLFWSEARITGFLGDLYSEAGVLNKAEEYYRMALSLDPGNSWFKNYVAYFLVDKDLNINEGLNLAETALKSDPDNSYLLHTRGWGLYKQGNYREALNILQKSWELNPVYDHSLFLHLAEVKKAVSDQK